MSFILLVEPDADAATAIEEVLVTDGLEVKVVADPDAALQIAAAQAPKLVVVSSVVRGAERLVESFARAKGGPGSIVIVAAGKRNSRQANALRADETVTAPFSPDDLKQAVERCWSTERGDVAGSTSSAGRQLSSEEIFGDVLAELSGEDEADSALVDIEAGMAEALHEVGAPSAPSSSPSRRPEVGEDVDALLASTLAGLDLSPTARTPAPARTADVPPVVAAPVEAVEVEEEAVDETETLEDLVEFAEESAATEIDPEPEEVEEPGETLESLAGSQEVEALSAIDQDPTAEAESQNRTVLIAAIAGTVIIGVLLVLLLNFTGGGEPEAGAVSPVDELPIVGQAAVNPPADEASALVLDADALVTDPDVEAVPGAPAAAKEAEPEAAEGAGRSDAGEPASSGVSTAPGSAAGSGGEPVEIEEPAPSPIVDQPETDMLDVAPAVKSADELESRVAEVAQKDEPEASDAEKPAPSADVAALTEGLEDSPTVGDDSAVPPSATSASVPASVPQQDSPPPAAAQVARSQEVVSPTPAASDEASAEAPTTPAAPQVTEAGEVPPELISFTRPRYPAMAKKLKMQGTVVVSVLVDESGKVVDAKIVEGVLKSFDQEVLRAARGARFKPATRGGEPVSMWRNLAIPMSPNN